MCIYIYIHSYQKLIYFYICVCIYLYCRQEKAAQKDRRGQPEAGRNAAQKILAAARKDECAKRHGSHDETSHGVGGQVSED